MRKYMFLLGALLCALPGQAQLQENLQVLDILPTENITSLEFKPRFKAKNDAKNDVSATLEIKPSFKLNKHWKFGAEIPVARVGNDEVSAKGLGDIMVSGTYVNYTPSKVFSYGLAMELTTPTATDRSLGDGKWVAEPEIFTVWKLSPAFFVEAEYRHILSFAGSSGRDDINESRYRMIFGLIGPDGWWFEFDPRYAVDYQNPGEAELIGEFELGTMINVGSSMYVRGGWHLGGNKYSYDWEFMMGFKILYL